MPRLAALRIAALEELAAQLRYAPRETLLKQLRRIEELAPEIDADVNYPEDWLIFRVTGYRPELANPATFVGGALLGDLSALVERLSAEARLAPGDMGEAAGVEELCARWSVSRKTLDRWRRAGLIAHRVRDDAGGARLLFSERAVEAFGGRRADLISRARGFSRTPESDERRIIRMAERARARFGWSLNEAAKHIGARTGRAHETVRQMLRRHDADAARPIFADHGPLTARERRIIFRAARRGVDPSTIGARYGRSRATIHRVVNERRAELLRALALPAPADAGAAGFAALESPLVTEGFGASVERTAEEFARVAAADAVAGRAREQALAAAHRALLRRAGATIAALARRSPRSADLDRAETDLRWAALLRIELVRAQRRLALQSIEAQVGRPLLELPAEHARELHRVAMDALIAAAAAFDPAKGGRLAAPAGMAVNRAVARAGGGRDVGAPPAGRARRAHASPVELDDWSARAASWQAWLDPDPRLRRRIDELPSPARDVAAARYGLRGRRPLTLDEAGAALGLTVARAAAAERQALRIARGIGAPAGAARADAPPGG